MQVAISNDSHAVSGSHFRVGWQIFNATYKLDTAVIRRTVESPASRHLALRQSAYSGGLVLAHYAIVAGHLWGCCIDIISNH